MRPRISRQIRHSLRPAVVCVVLSLPGWLPAQVSPDEYAARRQAVATEVGRGAVIAVGAPEPREDFLAFVQGPRFEYLTGYREPGAVLITIVDGDSTASTLYVHPRDPATEVWSGKRYGPDGATRATGIPARTLDHLAAALDAVAASGHPVFLVSDAAGTGHENADHRMLAERLGEAAGAVSDANAILDRLRGRKSADELQLIRKAVAITVAAQHEAMRLVEPGMNEFEVEGLIEYTFRRNGADRPAFASIVGSGPNATTLHYNANDRFFADDDVIVMDIGASYRGYAADVTRTIPVSGTFTAEQRAIYQLVRDAQAAAENEATLGADVTLMSRAAARTLADGLARLGLIQSADATFDCNRGGQLAQCPQLQLFYMHGLSHGIGLEVHDPEQFYHTRRIEPGSAFTIEPGIYVRAHVLTTLPDTPRNREIAAALRAAVERYANIGVRIEDDYIATAEGVEWISRAPREIDEVEAAMREAFTGPRPRDPAIVEWYRATEPKPSSPTPRSDQ